LINFNPDINSVVTEAERNQLAICSQSSAAMAKCFFPETFFSPYSVLHKEMLRLIDSPAKKSVIAAPRGLGKTSTVLFGRGARDISFRLKKFVVFLTNSSDIAVLQTENLKHELLSNTLVRKMFGPIDARQADGVDERFSKKAWVTSGGTFVLPRGAGQQVRGILYHSRRPDLIIIDDLEDKELIQSEEQREKLKEWFYSDLLRCISRYDQDYKIIYIDTLKHEDSLLQELLDSDDWESVRLDVCNDRYETNAPDFMTTEEIREEVESYKAKGKLDTFYREMRNIPVAHENKVFKQEYFQYYRKHKDGLQFLDKTGQPLELLRDPMLRTVVIVDPAKTLNMTSAYSAVVGVSIHRQTGRILVREIINDRMDPKQLYDSAFDMVRRLKAFMLAVEVTSLHLFISQPIQNKMRKENLNVLYHELKAVGKKEERIKELGPYYKQGSVWHNITGCEVLEAQLFSYPRSKFWDVMDALAYINKIMADFAIYFDPIDYELEDLEFQDEQQFKSLRPEPDLGENYLRI
jgi:hypothetical protein